MSETAACPSCGRLPLSDPATAALFYDAMRARDPDQLPSLEGWLRLAHADVRWHVLRWIHDLLMRPPLRGAPAGTEPLVTFLDAVATDLAAWVDDRPDEAGVVGGTASPAEIGEALGGVFA